MLENLQQEKGIFWTLPVALVLNLIIGLQGWTSIGLAFTGFYILNVIAKMGYKIPIIELMTTLAALQWIVGPYIDYHNSFDHFKYYMYIPEDQYMAFAVPALIAFRLGTLAFKEHSRLDDIGQRVKRLLTDHPKLPYILIAAGLIIPYLNAFIPAGLRFVFFLLSNVKYVGVIYLLFSDKPNRWPAFMGVMSITAFASIASGMFHDLLLWAMLTFTFVARELRLSYSKKISIALLGMFLAITIQSVKHEYRAMIHSGYSGNKISLFIGLAADNWSSGRIVTPSSEDDMNSRLNQGWIISAVMKNVPKNEPYAMGGTIIDAISSSLLPRFLAPNKKGGGGRTDFIRFTGLSLNKNTSMGISLAGEAYANFGALGGVLSMLVWGMFIGWIWKKLFEWSYLYPTLLIWSPIIFLQVIKAESDLITVLNHLIKSIVLVMGLLWFIKRQFRIPI